MQFFTEIKFKLAQAGEAVAAQRLACARNMQKLPGARLRREPLVQCGFQRSSVSGEQSSAVIGCRGGLQVNCTVQVSMLVRSPNIDVANVAVQPVSPGRPVTPQV
jgi:hypothetical protein